MGVPAIYAAETGRGYTDEQEKRYGLVKNLRKLESEALKKLITTFLNLPKEQLQQAHQELLNSTINVADYVVEHVLNYDTPSNPETALCGEN